MTRTSPPSRLPAAITLSALGRLHPAEELANMEILELDLCCFAKNDENEAGPPSQKSDPTNTAAPDHPLRATADDDAALLLVRSLSSILQSCRSLKSLTVTMDDFLNAASNQFASEAARLKQQLPAPAPTPTITPTTLQELTLCGTSSSDNEDNESTTTLSALVLGIGLLLNLPLSSLRRLTLQDVVFTTDEDSCRFFLLEEDILLAQNKSIELLQLHHCRSSIGSIHSALINYLPVTIQAMECIECDFSAARDETNNCSSSTQVTPIQLTSVRLIECRLTDNDLNLLCRQQRMLKTLDLRGNPLSTAACNCIAALLSDEECFLEKLILEQTGLDNEKLQLLCRDGLKHNRSLCKLNLRDNSQWTDCFMLKYARNLQQLDLSDNPQLGNNGIASLRIMISLPNSPLRRLQLENCGLTKQGLGALFERGASSTPLLLLEHLNLSCNNLTGVRDWSWTRLPQLQSLQLASCHLADVDLEQWVAFQQQHTSSCLQQLDLKHNSIARATTIAEILLRHPQLQKLDIQFNPFSKSDNNDRNMAPIVNAVRYHHYNLAQLLMVHPYSQRRMCKNIKSETSGSSSSSSSTTLSEQEQLNHWLKLNQAGRSTILRNDKNDQYAWTEQLQYAESVYGISALFHFVRESPHGVNSD